MLREQIEKAASGEKPIMCLDEAHAKSIQGPGTMDGIGPTQGWEIYWMEVDVNRRRGAPWASAGAGRDRGQGAASHGGGMMFSSSLRATDAS